jgi:hypothetical protein
VCGRCLWARTGIGAAISVHIAMEFKQKWTGHVPGNVHKGEGASFHLLAG